MTLLLRFVVALSLFAIGIFVWCCVLWAVMKVIKL